ncbi:MAG: phosphopantetheine-binding protein [Gammaproteobacteria bacterium]
MDETTRIATRLLGRIRGDLLETGESFGLDSDLFAAGLDSMSIMQIILFIEEEFAVKLPDGAVTRATFSTARRIAEAIRQTQSL